MLPSHCPVCGEPGGFHDYPRHAQGRRRIEQHDVLALVADLGEEVGDGQDLDDLVESLGQMARGEGRTVNVVESPERGTAVQDRR